MILVHPDFDFTIHLGNGDITLLTIEAPEIMRCLLVDLLEQQNGADGLFVLSHNDKILQIKDHVEVILSPLCFDQKPKRLMTKINAMFKSFVVDGERYIKTQRIISDICRYAEEMISEFDADLDYEEISADSLVKLLSLSPETENDNKIEILLDHINLMQDVLNIRTFVICNLQSFFSHVEVQLFIDNCRSLEANLILIESIQRESKFENVSEIIIDSDSCVLY